MLLQAQNDHLHAMSRMTLIETTRSALCLCLSLQAEPDRAVTHKRHNCIEQPLSSIRIFVHDQSLDLAYNAKVRQGHVHQDPLLLWAQLEGFYLLSSMRLAGAYAAMLHKQLDGLCLLSSMHIAGAYAAMLHKQHAWSWRRCHSFPQLLY